MEKKGVGRRSVLIVRTGTDSSNSFAIEFSNLRSIELDDWFIGSLFFFTIRVIFIGIINDKVVENSFNLLLIL